MTSTSGDSDQERTTAQVLVAILNERERQLEKWGEQRHADGTGYNNTFYGESFADVADDLRVINYSYVGGVWCWILLEEVFEALAEEDQGKLREELIQAAAVITAWIEDIDTRK